jgi:predicted metal-dependent peptidase
MQNNLNKRLIQARISLLDKQPFLGSLSMRLNVIMDNKVQAACCNGLIIKFNLDFISKLSFEELKFLYAHEILHIAFEHGLRLQERNKEGFNIAGDYADRKSVV